VVIWYIFANLFCLSQEKSGNPDRDPGDRLCRVGKKVVIFYVFVPASFFTVPLLQKSSEQFSAVWRLFFNANAAIAMDFKFVSGLATNYFDS
jgi:hypothetical protein